MTGEQVSSHQNWSTVISECLSFPVLNITFIYSLCESAYQRGHNNRVNTSVLLQFRRLECVSLVDITMVTYIYDCWPDFSICKGPFVCLTALSHILNEEQYFSSNNIVFQTNRCTYQLSEREKLSSQSIAK